MKNKKPIHVIDLHHEFKKPLAFAEDVRRVLAPACLRQVAEPTKGRNLTGVNDGVSKVVGKVPAEEGGGSQ